MATVPKMSILIPIYNVEQYLDECLNSVVNQTLKDIEIICINDGSTDKSLDIVKGYAKNDNRIVLINKKNSGYGDSMNKGLDKAKGEYIGIVESDDWIEKDAFEKLYSIATSNNVEVVKSNFYNYFTTPEKTVLNGTTVELVHPNECDRVLDPKDTLHIFLQRPAIWTGIYNREFLNRNNIRFLTTPGASYQDTGFNFKVWSTAKKVVFTKQAFLHYRQDNDASSINSPGKVYCIQEEFEEIKRYLEDHGLIETFGEKMRLARWGAYNWNIDRLTAELAEEFIRAASKEYREEYERGVFNFELCDANQTRDVYELIHNPEMMIQRKYAAQNAKVSVIVPVYNAAKYLRKSVDAVLNQTLKDIEVMIIDDGSTDESGEILEDFFKKDPRIRLISQYNQGQAVARNRGIELSHAKYVTFSDGDDYFEPDAVESLYDAITNEQSDLAVGRIRMHYEDKRFNSMEKNSDKQYYTVKYRGTHKITDELLDRVDVSPCNKIFKRSIIAAQNIQFPSGLRYEDAYFFFAYAWSSQKITFLPPEKFIYNYIRRRGSTMAQTFGGTHFAYDHIEIVIKLFEFLRKNNLFTNHARYYCRMFALYFNLSLNYLPSNQRHRLYSRTKEFIQSNKQTFQEHDLDLWFEVKGGFPRYYLIWKAAFFGKRVLKKIAKKILPRISISYRAQRIILESLADINYKVDRLELDMEYKLAQIENIDENKRRS